MPSDDSGIMPPVNCRGCGGMVDDATSVSHERMMPRVGSPAICVYCLTVSVFEMTPFGLTLVPPSPELEMRVKKTPQYLTVVLMHAALRGKIQPRRK
jgi:hypothetical protein